MPTPKFLSSARVTLVVEVEHGSSYGAGTTIDQIHKQASEETKNYIEAVLRDKGGLRLTPVKVTVDQVFVRIREDDK